METRRCVHVVLYATRPLRILLLRRPEARSPGWQGVTGRIEPHDHDGVLPRLLLSPPATAEIPTLARAALREINEETGLPPPLLLEDLGLEREFDGYDHVHYRQRTFAAQYADTHDIHRLPEHEEARWLPAYEALTLARWESDRTAIQLLLERAPPDDDDVGTAANGTPTFS